MADDVAHRPHLIVSVSSICNVSWNTEKLTLRSNIVQFHRNQKPSGILFSHLHCIYFQDSAARTMRILQNKRGILYSPFHKSSFYNSGRNLHKQSRKEMVATSLQMAQYYMRMIENKMTLMQTEKGAWISFFLLDYSVPDACAVTFMTNRKGSFTFIVLHTSWMSSRFIAQWIFWPYFLIIFWQKHLVRTLTFPWVQKLPDCTK